MTDTKELLERIARLRARLAESEAIPAPNPLAALEQKVRRGAHEHAHIDSALRAGEPAPHQPMPMGVRLTARGARLLRKGKEMLQALRKIADDVDFDASADDLLAHIHREAMAMIEVLLRTAQTFPAALSVQLRMCDGLEVVLGEIGQRIDLLCNHLSRRRHTQAQINELADYLRSVAAMQPVGTGPLQACADMILKDARELAPLHFLYAAPEAPARFAAAHSLNVAQVMARVLMDDAEWRPQLQLAIMAALVHDAGMARVPSDVLMTPGPLDNDERRIIEKHTMVAEEMLSRLWPGGGWPTEAGRDHHERSSGTGYPLGQRGIQLAPYVPILAACDVYAAMCAPRPHRPAFDTRTALTEALMLAERDYLDRTAAERLLLLSFYPVGSAVELNDGAIALVTATHPGTTGMTNPAKPIVQIVRDVQGQPVAWPSVVDLLAESDRSIVRSLRAGEREAMLGRQFAGLCA